MGLSHHTPGKSMPKMALSGGKRRASKLATAAGLDLHTFETKQAILYSEGHLKQAQIG